MKSGKKALLLALCAVLLVAATVMGTMAYLTSQDQVINTFTIGNVAITLDETKVDVNGNAVTPAERTKANTYKLMPGHTYTKDPTVTVLKGSEESYIRMLVTVEFGKALDDEKLATSLDAIFTGFDGSKWSRVSKAVSEDKKTIAYEYRYCQTVAAPDADTKLEPLFKNVEIPGTWTNDDLAAIGSAKITIVAQAIQADGFADADAAWKAFN